MFGHNRRDRKRRLSFLKTEFGGLNMHGPWEVSLFGTVAPLEEVYCCNWMCALCRHGFEGMYMLKL